MTAQEVMDFLIGRLCVLKTKHSYFVQHQCSNCQVQEDFLKYLMNPIYPNAVNVYTSYTSTLIIIPLVFLRTPFKWC